ncbi:MAG TPA: PduL/EutD family phosphate acyltransferase [Anaerolineales bacterium]|nr:PduL/EutD family phosphate acyltransferase [Anaerolineales bacterium]HRF49133.1 PduL/EutD family phosphate acyltransferase [Anaerolineales bacterium]
MEQLAFRNGAALNLDQISQAVIARLAQIEVAGEDSPEPIERNGRLELTVPIGISVRHLHLCDEHVAILFGEGHSLTVYNELYQKGYYAAKEQVMVVGKRRCIETVRVLGPTRPYSQVELAQTEALQLGLKLPIATEGADPACKPITLVGPQGVVTLPGGGKGGAFIARRHVHMSDVAARRYGVKNGDLLDLFIDGARPTTLHGVLVRVKAGWRNEIHLDTDEGNAVGIRNGQTGTLIIPIK